MKRIWKYRDRTQMIYLRWCNICLEIRFLQTCMFLTYIGYIGIFYLSSLENLIWSFIKSPSSSTIINPFCNFLFSSFLISYRFTTLFLFLSSANFSYSFQFSPNPRHRSFLIFTSTYFTRFQDIHLSGFYFVIRFLLIASNLPHLLTSFYPSNYLFYSPHTSVCTISIRIFYLAFMRIISCSHILPNFSHRKSR